MFNKLIAAKFYEALIFALEENFASWLSSRPTNQSIINFSTITFPAAFLHFFVTASNKFRKRAFMQEFEFMVIIVQEPEMLV